jgi:DNA (cytosine-5)-methyltransferase 1
MRYLSVCSGVEAATVAWHHMGWQAAGFSEIEKFPSEVLAHHYPTVTNFGDMTKYKEWNLNDPIGLLVGGTPCQSFSVAGLRKGLDDPRGNLALTYLGILDQFRPKWCVWENVPGVLSSGGGRDFGAFLGALGELGYGFAYRVLDAQNFGVAQRRRRVFVVGCLGDWRPAAEVLFESESLRGNIKKGRKERQDPAAFTASSFGSYSEGVGTIRAAGGDLGGGSETLYVPDVASCLQTTCDDYSRADGFNMIAIQGNLIGREKGGPQGIGVSEGETMYTLTKADVHGVAFGFLPTQGSKAQGIGYAKEIAPTLRAGCDSYGLHEVAFGWQNSASQSMSVDTISPTLDKSKTPAVAFAQNQLGEVRENNVFNTLNTNSNASGRNTPLLRQNMAVRRLTPVECERLQGFPDDYTNIKDKCPDGPRYKAMGNSMAVPVMRWIGERINKVNSLL